VEETKAFDPQRFIWETLPLHPQPQPLESCTSYILRLAEANGMKSTSELATIAGASTGFQFERRNPDYPHRRQVGLVRSAGCVLSTIQKTTFFHLSQHFGYGAFSPSFQRFLQGSLAPSLRYCPSCLAERALPYYSLIWRFSSVPGCIQHHCALLDHCGHCSSPLPHLPLPPQIARCPTCQGDLRACRTTPLSHKVLPSARIRTRDLEMLLSPPKFQVDGSQARVIGKRFAELRQHKGLSTTEMATLMEREEAVIWDIEHVSPNKKATFGDYLHYADQLGYSLREIFDKNRLQAFLALPCEYLFLA